VRQVEKLEVIVHELNIRVEELNRTVIDVTSHKTRISQENLELIKEVQDLKVNIENATYLKSQLAGQLEDARRRLEDDERVSYRSKTNQFTFATLYYYEYSFKGSLHRFANFTIVGGCAVVFW